MSDCRFCSIVRGKSPATKIYEDDNTLAFLDIKPITPGHVLVVPKRHSELLTELDDELVGKLFRTVKKVALAIKKSKLGCRGINYIVADGAEAGQEIFHVHVHIIPRYRSDGFFLHMPAKYDKETTLEGLEKIAGKIRIPEEE